MEFYDARGRLVCITYDGGTPDMPDYVVTVAGEYVGRLTRYMPGEWFGRCACAHGDAFTRSNPRDVAQLLIEHAWHYSSRYVY